MMRKTVIALATAAIVTAGSTLTATAAMHGFGGGFGGGHMGGFGGMHGRRLRRAAHGRRFRRDAHGRWLRRAALWRRLRWTTLWRDAWLCSARLCWPSPLRGRPSLRVPPVRGFPSSLQVPPVRLQGPVLLPSSVLPASVRLCGGLAFRSR